TVLLNVNKADRCWREEIFGPVVAIIPFDDETQMLRDVNASPYGLSGSLWTNDLRRALRGSRAVQSGVLSVNSHSSVHVEAPFGGFKTRGIGRHLSITAMERYKELKNVYGAEGVTTRRERRALADGSRIACSRGSPRRAQVRTTRISYPSPRLC